MSTEVLILAALGFLACLPLARLAPRHPLLLAGLGIAFVGIVAWELSGFQRRTMARVHRVEQLTEELPSLGSVREYVSSQRCRACHPLEHATWHRTYHRTMTQVALPENVVGAFDGTTVVSHGLPYRVYRKGDEFWAEMPDPDMMMYALHDDSKRIGEWTYRVPKMNMTIDLRTIPRVHRPVVMTTGSHHYQTYWVSSERYHSVMQTLPLVYLIKDERWIPREAAFMHPPGPNPMITQWNHHCIRCHSTGGVPGLDRKTGMLNTRVAELGIACESCHGPAEEHIRQNRDPRRRYRLHWTVGSDPTIVNPKKLNHRASSEMCGQCHGVYVMRGEYGMKYAFDGVLYRPGDDLHKTRYYIQHPNLDPSAKRQADFEQNPDFFEERWWEDGTVLAGGREYTAMSVSGCYTRGKISCLSCHSMHQSDPVDQLKPDMDTSASCTQCHSEARYTSAVTRHTYHAAQSPGSNCLNCHMPHTTYALLKAIRNHQIAAPNLAGSIRYGTPNACNLCHLDKTLAWTQKHMATWYGTDELPLTDEQQNVSAALLWLLKGNAAQRVTVAWHVGWKPAQQASGADWLAPFQARLLADPYGVVRYVAAENLRKLPGFERFDFDFLAPVEELNRRVADAVCQWQTTRQGPPIRSGDPVLIAPDGRVMDLRVEKLLEQRDNRAVSIKE